MDITSQFSNELNAGVVSGNTDIVKVSVVGVGMISKPGVAAKMFETLGTHNVNIQLITTSEIKISCAIASDQADLAVQVLHEAFNLGYGLMHD